MGIFDHINEEREKEDAEWYKVFEPVFQALKEEKENARRSIVKKAIKPITQEKRMSENREFKPVNKAEGGLEFIRPAELAKEGVTGVILEGEFQGTIPNHFDESKNDFKFRTDEGKTVIINHTGSLAYQLKEVEPGSIVQIEYKGKEALKSGKMKGKLAHQFGVLVA